MRRELILLATQIGAAIGSATELGSADLIGMGSADK
jgi:hypothetical protein